ncbi:LuxR family transcriptional regulator [Catenulispora sp. NL8]|uniref:LuxR family transcriptional regulator n=1 Tax=Catenulispora pinistramenti TaxID=2705254 RepID=A0ABS5KQD7_9ACTN|nr:LuxR family transcriptional regulator [Catenulispora pinistramenti]MBS2548262.1 LuxR family transcriptional regulator [Catenulispora pinistramenti]
MLGLSSQAEAVYAAMLADPGAELEKVISAAGLDERSVRAGLDELAEFAFVRPSRDMPGTFRVVSPEVALDAMVRRQEAELARQAQELAANKVAAAAAVAEYGRSASAATQAGGERLIGLDAVAAKLELLAKEAREECLSVMPGGAQSAASLNASRPLDAAALERGVDVQTLYQESVRNDAATFAYAQWLTSQGGQVCTAPLLPPRMAIVDRHTVLVPIDPADTKAGALCTSEPAIVASLIAVYRQAWATAVPLGADRTPGTDGLSRVEHDLLLLLAQGLTDDAAAKRLGLGLRTVSRQMTGLMERLGATSRFEAGLKAAQRGWL